jgi:chromosome segregation ATPase
LKKKRAILEQLQQLAEEKPEDAKEKAKELQNEWNETGHVPFKDKDALYESYRKLSDQIFGAQGGNRKGHKKNAGDFAATPMSERNRLQKAYEKLAAEIKTYENNLNFLSSNSKKGNSLVDQMVKRMEKLKEELAQLQQKIKALDEEIWKDSQD